jgi:hydrogenase maturation factor
LGTGIVSALHDPTEGGLATAIHEIAEASGLGARIDADAIPILPSTRRICQHLGLNPLGLLSSGALLIATRPDTQTAVIDALAASGIPVQRIGALTNREKGCTIIRQGEVSPLPRFDSDELARALIA